ncbi:MAG TPA: gliding motility-associated C-terminal domain-containing protein, partial [Chitinophagaceae bacterium]|nr:gliding motility-associated C-terminal domain-containing protein [Chitinophagaceae bacterium]
SSPTSGVIFNWTNNNTSIGLAGSGTGDLPSFTTSANATVQVATISVVAYDGICFGPAMTFTITVNPIVNPSFTSVASICAGDVLAPLPLTSTNGITGTWSSALNNLTTTTYTFTPSIGQCASNSNLTIAVSQPVTPSFAPVATTCYGATLAALPTISINGIIGSWTPALNNTTTTTYTFTPNAGQCANNATLTITIAPQVTISSINITNPNCVPGNNGSITVNANGGLGGLNYDIGSGAQTNNVFTNLGSGNYTVNVSDANGCSASSTTNLSAPNAPSITTANATDITCNGLNNGSITISNVSGGSAPYSYSIDNCTTYQGGNSFTNLSAGTYTICVKDGNNCTVTSTLLINEPAAIMISSLTATNPNCVPGNNGSITVNANGGLGGLNYNIGSGVQTSNSFTNLGSGNYTVTVSDANGCSASSTTNLSAPNAPSITTANATDITCNGLNNGSITISNVSGGSAPYSYSIDNCTTYQGGNSFTNLSAGTYTICVKDGNNCTVTSTLLINEPAAIMISSLTATNPNCVPGNNGSITVNANGGLGGLNYNIGSGVQTSNSFTNLGSGNYTVTVSDANGCSVSSTTNLSAPNAPTMLGVGVKDITCYGAGDGTVVSSGVTGGTPPFTYTLLPLGTSNGSGAFTGLGPGTYQILVSDGNGCTVLSNNVQVLEPAEIKIINSVIQPLTCNDDINGSIELMVTGGQGSLTYTITPNSGIQITPGHFIQLPKGNYSIMIQDSVGCSTVMSFSIEMPTPITVSLDIKPITCKGVSFGEIIAAATGGSGDYVYKIRPGLVINKTGYFKNLHTGVYTLTITDSSGCQIDTAITMIESGDYLRTTISKRNLSCFGTGFEGQATANIEGGEAPYTLLWSTDPPQATATIDQLTFGYYFLEVTDQIGCVVKDTVYIEPGICCEEVFIPNAFSPNSDGNNDFFKVVTSAGIEMIQLEVYNRWGNRLWSARTFRDEWNGRYHEIDQDMDTYFYIFKYKCLTDGQIYVKKGDLLLMR